MKFLFVIFIFFLLQGETNKVYSQTESVKGDDVKGKKIIRELDEIIETSELLRKKGWAVEKLLPDLDTIHNQTAKIKAVIKRRIMYAQEFSDDYSYYSDMLKYANESNNVDNAIGIINDVKQDLLLKTISTFNPVDSSGTLVGSGADFSLINLKVRVWVDSSVQQGYEVYIKKGTYIPSKDSTRIPQLTDNAVIPISAGNFTVVAWKGKQYATARVSVRRTKEEFFPCDLKVK